MLSGPLGSSIHACNDRANFFQQALGFKGEACQIKRMQRTIMCRQSREAGLLGEVSLLVFGVAVSKTAQPAEQITHGNNTGEPRVANGFGRRMVAGNGLDKVRRKVPARCNDLAAFAVVDPQSFLFGFMQRNPPRASIFERAAETCGETHSSATIPTSSNKPAA